MHMCAFSIRVLTELRAPSIGRFLHNGWETAEIFLNRRHSSRKRFRFLPIGKRVFEWRLSLFPS
jgi:hypothetical protein